MVTSIMPVLLHLHEGRYMFDSVSYKVSVVHNRNYSVFIIVFMRVLVLCILINVHTRKGSPRVIINGIIIS